MSCIFTARHNLKHSELYQWPLRISVVCISLGEWQGVMGSRRYTILSVQLTNAFFPFHCSLQSLVTLFTGKVWTADVELHRKATCTTHFWSYKTYLFYCRSLRLTSVSISSQHFIYFLRARSKKRLRHLQVAGQEFCGLQFRHPSFTLSAAWASERPKFSGRNVLRAPRFSFCTCLEPITMLFVRNIQVLKPCITVQWDLVG